MPVTAKLSQKFYERLGEDVANELVEWFNAVDAAYKTDLRELNERNFQRFDDRVERRFADFRAYVDRRFAEADARLERRVGELRDQMRAELGSIGTDLLERIAGADRRVADTRADLVKWMFGFWIATLVPLAGLMVGLATILH